MPKRLNYNKVVQVTKTKQIDSTKFQHKIDQFNKTAKSNEKLWNFEFTKWFNMVNMSINGRRRLKITIASSTVKIPTHHQRTQDARRTNSSLNNEDNAHKPYRKSYNDTNNPYSNY